MITVFWKTTFIYGLGFLGLRLVSFLLVPLYTHLLSPSDTGILFIVYTILAFLNTIYSRGMDASLFKFYTKKNHYSIISTSILYSLKHGGILSILIGFLLWVCFYCGIINPLVFTKTIIFGLLFVLFWDSLAARCMNILRIQERPFYYLFASLTNICSSILLNIYLIKNIDMGLHGGLWAIVISSFIQIIILSPIIITNVKLNLLDSELLIKMKSFSLPFLPAAIFLILIELSDRWMIGLMSENGAYDVGIYGVGYKFGSLIMLCVRAFNLNWQPFYLKDNTAQTFYKVGTIFLGILIILSTMISIIWPLLFTFLIGQSFWAAGSIIPIIAISYIFYGIFILQMPSLYLKDKERWAPLFWGSGFIINLTINYFLIPLYGYYGAAFATLCAYLFMAIFIIYKNYTWMPMAYSAIYTGIIILISGTAYASNYYLKIFSENGISTASYITISTIYLFFVLPIIWVIQKKL